MRSASDPMQPERLSLRAAPLPPLSDSATPRALGVRQPPAYLGKTRPRSRGRSISPSKTRQRSPRRQRPLMLQPSASEPGRSSRMFMARSPPRAAQRAGPRSPSRQASEKFVGMAATRSLPDIGADSAPTQPVRVQTQDDGTQTTEPYPLLTHSAASTDSSAGDDFKASADDAVDLGELESDSDSDSDSLGGVDELDSGDEGPPPPAGSSSALRALGAGGSDAITDAADGRLAEQQRIIDAKERLIIELTGTVEALGAKVEELQHQLATQLEASAATAKAASNDDELDLGDAPDAPTVDELQATIKARDERIAELQASEAALKADMAAKLREMASQHQLILAEAANEHEKKLSRLQKDLDGKMSDASQLVNKAATRLQQEKQRAKDLEEQFAAQVKEFEELISKPKHDFWHNELELLAAIDLPGISELSVAVSDDLEHLQLTGMYGSYEQNNVMEDYTVVVLHRLPEESPEFAAELKLPEKVVSNSVRLLKEDGTLYVTMHKLNPSVDDAGSQYSDDDDDD
eukprot:TRINITY_DN18782_c0_g1_i1.p1 TRINITY_DN18782_c0_g1~~TRINITY_DN18782_c0_g1_i1.p1  ORF type:complete len:521 (-),score=241.91 TRINITY_DN18782_c0_g1_i1:166-1728(-)